MTFEEKLIKIAQVWDKKINRTEKNINIQGSPARSDFRIAVSSPEQIYILEKYGKEKEKTKNKIYLATDYLHKKIKEIITYERNQKGEFALIENGAYWHLIKYIKGTDLPRPDYAYDSRYAKALIDFQNRFNAVPKEEIRKFCKEKFHLGKFCLNLLEKLKKNDPDIYQKITFSHAYAERTEEQEQKAEFNFSHGDFHPLNIIWDNFQIKTLIDWEFCNWKIKGYDYGLLVGCLGMENPTALLGDLAKKLTAENYDIKKYFFDLILCIRLLWLSNWLHIGDKGMTDLEISYLKLLNLNREKIENAMF
ncbi:MAG: hypothetical protein CSB55_00890 [Candidatus Cloacimonadota bacterium]|nr:MAG: hypothetical protein CSB55_00890 [Candidatus Cloacimonadota bacterium]